MVSGDAVEFYCVAVFAPFCLGCIGGSTPVIIKRITTSSRTKHFIKLGNAFSAGVLLAAGICHLLADGAFAQP